MQDRDSTRTPVEYEDATPDDVLLTAREAADAMRVDVGTLANLRTRGEGLPYYKPEGRVLYKLSDVMMAVNGSGRGYSRARLAAAIETWRGARLTSEQRADLIAHVQAAMWR